MLSVIVGRSAPVVADWPMFYNGSNPHSETDKELVSSFDNATRIWKSEEYIPDARASRRAGPKLEIIDDHNFNGNTIGGGMSSVICTEEDVFFAYFIPRGELGDTSRLNEEAAAEYEGWGLDKWAINADDVIVCIDAETGVTKWKKVFADSGMNTTQIWNKENQTMTPAYGDGKVFFIGTLDILYALDASDGSLLWTRHLDGYENRLKKKQKSLDRLSLERLSGGQNTMYVDNLVYVRQGDEITAFDAETGDFKWELEVGRTAHNAADLIWEKDGKCYIIAANTTNDEQPKTVCIDPSTGTAVWTIDGVAFARGHTMGVWEDYLLVTKLSSGVEANEPKGRLVCYKMTPESYEYKWVFEGIPDSPHLRFVVIDGYVYLGGRDTDGKSIRDSMYCIDIESGEQKGSALFGEDIGEEEAYLIGVGDRLIFGAIADGGGKALLYDADPENFRLLEKGDLGFYEAWGYRGSYCPAANDSRVFFRSRHVGLVCLDLDADAETNAVSGVSGRSAVTPADNWSTYLRVGSGAVSRFAPSQGTYLNALGRFQKEVSGSIKTGAAANWYIRIDKTNLGNSMK